jgi:nucleotidyltransferase/DNA polymerase involved in DNA repair
MISRSKTFLADEKDFEKVLNFGLGEVLFLAEQLRREHLEVREVNVCVRFGDFSEVAATRRFRAPQREPDFLGAVFGELFRGLLARRAAPVRQLRVALRGLSPRPPQRLLFE